MTISSIQGDDVDLAQRETDRNFTVAFNRETTPLTYYVVYVNAHDRVIKLKPFVATAGKKRKYLESLGIDLDDPNGYAVIARTVDDRWLQACGNEKLFKHLPKH